MYVCIYVYLVMVEDGRTVLRSAERAWHRVVHGEESLEHFFNRDLKKIDAKNPG